VGTDGVTVAELSATPRSTVALRGPMVPRHAFPPGIARSDQPHFAIGDDGLVDTGYACEADILHNTLRVTTPPAGVVNIGGSRLPLALLRDKVAGIDGGAILDVMPDPLLGQRLVGMAADPEAMQNALAATGQNPLIGHAFAATFAEAEEAPATAKAIA
jgi:hypothetical protein